MTRYMPIALCLCFTATISRASLITFETTPTGDVPIDNALMDTPYNITGGGTVDFFFDVNNNNVFDAGIDRRPAYEQIGQDGSDAFVTGRIGPTTDPNAYDNALPGFEDQLGEFFLRANNVDVTTSSFIINYNTTQSIDAFTGEIWDIDGVGFRADRTEQWFVEALNGSDAVIDSVLSPLGVHQTEALDGEPWVFSFDDLPESVSKVRFSFVGTRPGGGGFSFNNFGPTISADEIAAVPEPSAWGIISLACLIGILFRQFAPPALRFEGQ